MSIFGELLSLYIYMYIYIQQKKIIWVYVIGTSHNKHGNYTKYEMSKEIFPNKKWSKTYGPNSQYISKLLSKCFYIKTFKFGFKQIKFYK